MSSVSQSSSSATHAVPEAVNENHEVHNPSFFRILYFMILLFFLIVNSCASFSIMTSTLTVQVTDRNLSLTIAGLIIAADALGHVLGAMSVFLLIRHFQFRFLLICACVTNGSIQMLTSGLEFCPDSDNALLFPIMAISLRTLGGVSVGVVCACAFACLPLYHNPQVYRTMNCLLGVSTIMGLAGGALFGAVVGLGGLYIPTLAHGCVFILLGMAVYFQAPHENILRPLIRSQVRRILVRPQMWFSGLQTVVLFTFIGFNLTILRPYMEIFLDEGQLQNFLINLITAPATLIAGRIHRQYITKPFIFSSFLCQSLNLFFMAPAQFLHLYKIRSWWLAIAQFFTVLAFIFGVPACTVDFHVESTVGLHLTDKYSICAAVGVLFNVFFPLGLCLGASAGGIVADQLRTTRNSIVVMGISLASYAGFYGFVSLLRFFLTWRRHHFEVGPTGHMTRRWPEAANATVDETSPLVGNSRAGSG